MPSDLHLADRATAPLSAFAKLEIVPDAEFFGLVTTLKNKDKVTGFSTLQVLLRYLYNMKPEMRSAGAVPLRHTNSQWEALRDEVDVGLVRLTNNFGTTSVSMGYVADLDRKSKEAGIPLSFPMVVLNCGSGGVKAQVFDKNFIGEDEIIYCVFEQKECGANPNPNKSVPIGSFKPEKWPENATEEYEDHARDREEKILFDFFCDFAETFEKEMGRKLDCSIPIKAFLTGPARKCYEKLKSQAERDVMNTIVGVYFDLPLEPEWSLELPEEVQKRYKENLPGICIDAFDDDSFFMFQTEEGEMEALACRTMYDNLFKGGILKTRPAIAMAMGKGGSSVQAGPIQIASSDDARVIKEYCEALDKTDAFDQIVDALEKAKEEAPGSRPMIAVKSLFVMFYDENKAVQDFVKTGVRPIPLETKVPLKTKTESKDAGTAPSAGNTHVENLRVATTMIQQAQTLMDKIKALNTEAVELLQKATQLMAQNEAPQPIFITAAESQKQQETSANASTSQAADNVTMHV